MIETFHQSISGDSRELNTVRDNSIDLIVTSPPYPMIGMWDQMFGNLDPRISQALERQDAQQAFGLMHGILDTVWNECYRVLAPGGFACINVGDATRSLGGEFRLHTNHARILTACERIGFRSLPPVLWRKSTNAPNKFMGSGMLPAGAYVTLEHEYILILRKGGKREFPTPSERVRRRRSGYFWEERNQWFSDLWDLSGVRQKRAAGLRTGRLPSVGRLPSTGRQESAIRTRSAAFPLLLALRLIHMYSLQQDHVLDPFNGTGTTQLAAVAACRNSTGIETDQDLVEETRDVLLGAADISNELTARRISDHLQFVENSLRSGSTLTYRNDNHGFPVKTRQETGIALSRVAHIDGHGPDGAVVVRYEPWNG